LSVAGLGQISKNGWNPALQELEPKSGATVISFDVSLLVQCFDAVEWVMGKVKKIPLQHPKAS